MSQKDRMIERSNHFRLLKRGQKRNCVRISTANNLLHEMEKLRVCYELQQWGHEYVTEAEWATGGRADVFDLDTGTIFEVLHSETLESFEKKKLYYPRGLRIIPLMVGMRK